MGRLYVTVEKTTNYSHEMIKVDVDMPELGRPWRILNLNRGIIASRTENTDINEYPTPAADNSFGKLMLLK